jgi:hypothetical protein
LTAYFGIVYKFRTPGLFTIKSSGSGSGLFFGLESGAMEQVLLSETPIGAASLWRDDPGDVLPMDPLFIERPENITANCSMKGV